MDVFSKSVDDQNILKSTLMTWKLLLVQHFFSWLNCACYKMFSFHQHSLIYILYRDKRNDYNTYHRKPF